MGEKFHMPALPRLNSIDALRGLTVAAMLVVNDAGDWGHVYPWLEHAEWFGCTLADFIFPIFMLIVGVSISLALGPKIEAAENRAELSRGVLLRGIRIVLLGIALHFIASLLLQGRGFRLLGVLQRIGICFAIAGLLVIHVRSARVQWGIFFAILVGYWALLTFTGPLTPEYNLADRIDSALLGRLAYQFDPISGHGHDPEGVLSTLPALATVIFGLRAGAWLRAGKIRALLLAGISALIVAFAWSSVFPFSKQLWTSSFVLWTGGFGILAIVLAHQLIDVRGWPPIGRSLGINAIAAYAGSWLATCLLEGTGAMGPLYGSVFEQLLSPVIGPFMSSLAFALAFASFFWILMTLMRKYGWRFTI
jgi:predicted acyltransferase